MEMCQSAVSLRQTQYMNSKKFSIFYKHNKKRLKILTDLRRKSLASNKMQNFPLMN